MRKRSPGHDLQAAGRGKGGNDRRKEERRPAFSPTHTAAVQRAFCRNPLLSLVTLRSLRDGACEDQNHSHRLIPHFLTGTVRSRRKVSLTGEYEKSDPASSSPPVIFSFLKTRTKKFHRDEDRTSWGKEFLPRRSATWLPKPPRPPRASRNRRKSSRKMLFKQ